ncbi:MAG: outer membrane beta-barrel protein [Candidatus Eisenbacteria bacterium]|uniref:Outer membrane beta-barrel protein n=1 Tax=Eiseniibacteriota bacterium TaxID=2212470 RepID=A0A937XCE2_UNCEI|nr:outer membrane beta-barrel protein [Candidatus Eisenbacteria bacterium]
MRWAFWLGLWAVVLWMGAAPATAEDPIGRISLGGSGGFSSYLLSDLNSRIANQGNHYLSRERGVEPLQTVSPLKELSPLEFGWTFWADLKVPVPFVDFLFLSGGYGSSSGATEGPDVDDILRIEARQTAFHARLLYVPPFRFQEDTRLFIGGGPLFIRNQEVTASQTNRTNKDAQWTEEITYSGSGTGWQVGLAAEYMIQDHMTLCVDLGYRFANLQYDSWSPDANVKIRVPMTAETEEYDRLHYRESYPGRVFLNWDATIAAAPATDYERLLQFGPNREYLQALTREQLGLDMSGMMLHIGLRFYLL